MAVADELRASGAEVSFLGTRERIEAELVPAAGYEINFVKVRGIDRRNPLRAARAGAEALAAVGAARKVLRRRGADVVLGGGGFVAGPAGLAATLTGTPLVLTEADSHLGLANRLLARRARRVCLAFPIAGREGEPYLVTGRPVPRAVLEGDRDAARRRFGIAAEDRCLLVFGGSQGARSKTSLGTTGSKTKLERAASWWANTTSVCAASGAPSSPMTFHVVRWGRRERSQRAGPPWRSSAITPVATAPTSPAARTPRRTAIPASADAAAGTPIGAK